MHVLPAEIPTWNPQAQEEEGCQFEFLTSGREELVLSLQ